MQKADCFYLGHIAKLHGYKGEVSLFFDTSHPNEYAQLDRFFLEISGNLTPFFVENIEPKTKGFYKVKIEGVDTEQDAKNLLKKEIYLPLSLLPELSGNNFYDHEVMGFTIIDHQFGEIGKLTQIIDDKANPLLQIQNEEKNKEVLLPLMKGLIQVVDRAKKELHVKAPEGLISLYLD